MATLLLPDLSDAAWSTISGVSLTLAGGGIGWLVSRWQWRRQQAHELEKEGRAAASRLEAVVYRTTQRWSFMMQAQIQLAWARATLRMTEADEREEFRPVLDAAREEHRRTLDLWVEAESDLREALAAVEALFRRVRAAKALDHLDSHRFPDLKELIREVITAGMDKDSWQNERLQRTLVDASERYGGPIAELREELKRTIRGA